MTLHLYLARRFLGSVLVVTGAFLAIVTLLEFVEQIRRLGGGEATLPELLGLALLRVPQTVYDILPLIIILATLALFLAMARSNEMVVTRAAGRSALNALAAPVLTAVLVGVLAVAVLNPIVAATSTRYETLSDRYSGEPAQVLSLGGEGLWLRQGDEDGQTVIHADRANLDGSILYDVGFFGFAPNGAPSYRIEAARAELVPEAWELTDAKEWRFGGNRNPERESVVHDTLRLPSRLTRGQIRDSFGTPATIPIWELPAFINRLEQSGFTARQHRVWLHMEFAKPLLLAAMVLTAAAFTLRHTRFGRTGIMVLMAMAMGFTLYFIRNFAQILGDNGQLPVALAAWGPPLAAILLPLGLLLHLEDG